MFVPIDPAVPILNPFFLSQARLNLLDYPRAKPLVLLIRAEALDNLPGAIK